MRFMCAVVSSLVVASSMSLYGEGLYRDAAGAVRSVGERSLDQLRRGEWEFRDADGSVLIPVPTPESRRSSPLPRSPGAPP